MIEGLIYNMISARIFKGKTMSLHSPLVIFNIPMGIFDKNLYTLDGNGQMPVWIGGKCVHKPYLNIWT
jgi:hypothetical protein